MSKDDARKPGAQIALLIVASHPEEGSRLRRLVGTSDAPRFEVTGVTNVEEALRMLHQGTFDALLLDLTRQEANDLDELMRLRVAAADTGGLHAPRGSQVGRAQRQTLHARARPADLFDVRHAERGL